MSDKFTSEMQDECLIVHLKMSQIDMFNVTELLEDLKPLIVDKHLIIDLESVGFVDSSGMGGLIRINQELKKQSNRLLLTNLNSKVNNLMRLTRSNKYLLCFGTLEEARKAIQDGLIE